MDPRLPGHRVGACAGTAPTISHLRIRLCAKTPIFTPLFSCRETPKGFSCCISPSVPHDKPGAPTGRYRTPRLAPSASRPLAGGRAGFVQRSPGRRPRPNKGPFYGEPAVWLPAASHLRSAGTQQLSESFFYLFFLNKSKFLFQPLLKIRWKRLEKPEE